MPERLRHTWRARGAPNSLTPPVRCRMVLKARRPADGVGSGTASGASAHALEAATEDAFGVRAAVAHQLVCNTEEEGAVNGARTAAIHTVGAAPPSVGLLWGPNSQEANRNPTIVQLKGACSRNRGAALITTHPVS